ncbi:hypothetical protein L7F22_040479 [Adiantum nelumboides]|nr:hypothetical protein [Adiantum nelumboides]
MDVKHLAVQPLVSKLASSSLEQQKEGVRELRLLAKWEADNRVAIAKSGAIPLLVKLLYSCDEKIQENAVTTLLNLSICDINKLAIIQASRALDAFVHALTSGHTMETKENTAALLFSLMVCEEHRPIIGQKAGIVAGLLDLLKTGSHRAQKDALKALFHIAICAENRPLLVANGAISVLLCMLSNSKSGLLEDVLAVLAQGARCSESAGLFLKASAISSLADILDTGSSRAQENAASALLYLCQSGGSQVLQEVLESSCISSLSLLLSSGSSRGKSKASALLQMLVVGQDL